MDFDLKLLLIKVVKSPWQKKVFSRIFFQLFILFKCLFAPFPEVKCPNFLDFWNPWGKVMERVIADLKTFAHEGCKIAGQKKRQILPN